MDSGLAALYDGRFNSEERRLKDRIWRVLCRDFFQRRVPPDATVLDLACGFGEFLRHIEAGRKLGVDLNPAVGRLLPADVRFIHASATELPITPASVDRVFVSNFFEHLRSKEEMDRVLREVRRILVPGGKLLMLQPNIRYAAHLYWDFYDHHLPLSHLSAVEAMHTNGFEVDEVIARFLPWSTKSKLPKSPWLVAAYLRFSPAWRLIGRQFFLAASKPAARQD